MPTFELTSPDGQKYRVTGPDGATEDDALQQLQSQLGQSSSGKVGRFFSNVYNNPPPTIAAIRDAIKGAGPAAKALTFGDLTPEEGEQAAGDAAKAAALGLQFRGLGGEGVAARPRPVAEASAPAAIPARPVAPGAPDAAALAAERTANYGAAANAGAEISPAAYRDLVGPVQSRIAQDFDPLHAPATFKQLELMAARGRDAAPDAMQAMTGVAPREASPVTGQEMEAFLQKLRGIKSTPSAVHDNAASKRARAAIDEAIAALPDDAFLAGDAAAYRDAIAAGRGNTAAMYRMKALEAADERSALNANTAYSGGNVENAGRQSFKSLVRPPVSGGPTPAQKIGFNEAEQQAIRDVAMPGLGRDILRGIGKFAPTDQIKAVGNVGAAIGTGGHSIPLTIGAYAAKKYGDKLMDQSIQRAMNVVGQRSPLAQKQQREYAAQLTKYRKAAEAAQKAAEDARAEFQKAVALHSAATATPLLLPGQMSQ